ncbi:MAG TPA: type 4a pilus biogenesis protein PilO [Candidatus Omnitrophota bacterium]|nr:type 4a pilus biogenesis protein PilO [Candidatus Omnitrophota bacterium]HRZ15585.1 type 4a pilus biogenesis protein PilO [Candidatus Omnitrophota bacterium]
MAGLSLNEIFEDRNKLIAVLAACALLFALDVAFVMKAQINGIKQSGQKVIALKKDLQKLNKDLAQMRQDASNKKNVKIKKIISERELPSLLQYVSSVAAENSIKVMQIDSQKEGVKLATRGGKSGSQQEGVVTVVIHLDLESDYHTIARFISQVENSDQVLYLDELKIARDVSDVMKQRVNLVLKTHVKK